MGKIIKAIYRPLSLALPLIFGVTLGQVSRAQAMSFEVVSLGGRHCGAHCPQVIAAEGEIGEGSPDEFLRFVQENLGSGDLHGIVLLDSPGGRVAASMELGQTIRSLGMAVIVARPGPQTAQTGDLFSGRCYSACVYALMGGRRRVIPPQSRVGVHRMFNYTTSFDWSAGGFVRERYLDDGDMRDKLARYSAMMGVSPNLIALAERTSPDRIHVLTRAEISRWRLGSQKL